MENSQDELLKKISDIEARYNELENFLSRSEVVLDNKLYKHFSVQKKQIEKCYGMIQDYKKLQGEIDENLELMKICESADERQKLSDERDEKLRKLEGKKKELQVYFANESLTEEQVAEIEISGKSSDTVLKFMDFLKLASESILAEIEVNDELSKVKICGVGVYDKLKNFSGKVKFVLEGKEDVLTVVVLNVESSVRVFSESDVEMQTLKSGGAGGQHINKTESAVRLLHIPTGISALCQDERSQSQNKQKAMEALKQKVEAFYEQNKKKNIEIQRKNIQNAVFSTTASAVFDYDRNVLVISKNNKSYKLSQILKGDMNLLFSEII